MMILCDQQQLILYKAYLFSIFASSVRFADAIHLKKDNNKNYPIY